MTYMQLRTTFLNKITKPFYFGSGGIGDALLLLSTFFDENKEQNEGVIFWANEIEPVKKFFNEFSKTSQRFPNGLEFIAVMQGFGYHPQEEFQQIINHPLYRGKGHIPDNLDFVNEWANNADKYVSLFKKPFTALYQFGKPVLGGPFEFDEPQYVGIMPLGSQQDRWKNKSISTEETIRLINKHSGFVNHVKLFGSESDKQRMPIESLKVNHPDKLFDCRGLSFADVFGELLSCWKVISTDTWVKSFSALVDIKTEVIESEYLVDVKSVFPTVGYDPADNIFLPKDWFTFIKRSEL